MNKIKTITLLHATSCISTHSKFIDKRSLSIIDSSIVSSNSPTQSITCSIPSAPTFTIASASASVSATKFNFPIASVSDSASSPTKKQLANTSRIIVNSFHRAIHLKNTLLATSILELLQKTNTTTTIATSATSTTTNTPSTPNTPSTTITTSTTTSIKPMKSMIPQLLLQEYLTLLVTSDSSLNFNQTLHIQKVMKELDSSPNKETLLLFYAKTKNTALLKQTLDSLDNTFVLSHQTIIYVLHALTLDKNQDYIEKFVGFICKSDDCKQDPELFPAALHLLCSSGLPQLGYTLKKSIAPLTQLKNKAEMVQFLRAYLKKGDEKGAMIMMQVIKESHLGLKTCDDGLNSCLEYFIQKGDLEKAKEFWKEICGGDDLLYKLHPNANSTRIKSSNTNQPKDTSKEGIMDKHDEREEESKGKGRKMKSAKSISNTSNSSPLIKPTEMQPTYESFCILAEWYARLGQPNQLIIHLKTLHSRNLIDGMTDELLASVCKSFIHTNKNDFAIDALMKYCLNLNNVFHKSIEVVLKGVSRDEHLFGRLVKELESNKVTFSVESMEIIVEHSLEKRDTLMAEKYLESILHQTLPSSRLMEKLLVSTECTDLCLRLAPVFQGHAFMEGSVGRLVVRKLEEEKEASCFASHYTNYVGDYRVQASDLDYIMQFVEKSHEYSTVDNIEFMTMELNKV